MSTTQCQAPVWVGLVLLACLWSGCARPPVPFPEDGWVPLVEWQRATSNEPTVLQAVGQSALQLVGGAVLQTLDQGPGTYVRTRCHYGTTSSVCTTHIW